MAEQSGLRCRALRASVVIFRRPLISILLPKWVVDIERMPHGPGTAVESLLKYFDAVALQVRT